MENLANQEQLDQMRRERDLFDTIIVRDERDIYGTFVLPTKVTSETIRQWKRESTERWQAIDEQDVPAAEVGDLEGDAYSDGEAYYFIYWIKAKHGAKDANAYSVTL